MVVWGQSLSGRVQLKERLGTKQVVVEEEVEKEEEEDKPGKN